MQRRLRPEDCTVGWVCTLPIKLAASVEMLDEEYQDPPSSSHGLYHRHGGHSLVLNIL